MNTSQSNRGRTTGESRSGKGYPLHREDGDALRVEFEPCPPLEAVYAAVERHDIDAALDVIYERVHDLMSAGKVDTLDAILQSADLDHLEPATATGLLSAMLPVAARLPHRQAFVVRLRAWLVGRVPDNEIEGLLAGLV